MKYGLFTILIAVILTSCYKPGHIKLQNNVSNAKLVNVRWGEILLGSELLTGQETAKVEIRKDDEKLPAQHQISFEMEANHQQIFLKTKREYRLEEDGDILIVIGDTTEVQN